jgi:malate permease and related proteins
MNIVMQALAGLFSVIFIIGIGYILAKKSWFDDNSSKVLARLVTSVALPLYMITNMTKNFTREKLLTMAPDLMVPILSVLLAYIIGKVVSHLIKVKEGRKGVFCTNFFIANTMFIGLPVNLALFGEKSIPAVMLYYMVNTIMFWTFGVHNIVQDSEVGQGKPNSIFTMTAIKKVCSPPLIGFFIGILAVLLEIPIPGFLNSTFRYIGNLTTPLSLIFIGIEMSRIPLSSIEFDQDMLWSILGRFLVCPLCVLCLVPFIPISPLSAQVFTMQAAMPAMTQMAIVAKAYGADSGYAATLSLVTVLAGIIVIPAYMFLVSTVLS